MKFKKSLLMVSIFSTFLSLNSIEATNTTKKINFMDFIVEDNIGEDSKIFKLLKNNDYKYESRLLNLNNVLTPSKTIYKPISSKIISDIDNCWEKYKLELFNKENSITRYTPNFFLKSLKEVLDSFENESEEIKIFFKNIYKNVFQNVVIYYTLLLDTKTTLIEQSEMLSAFYFNVLTIFSDAFELNFYLINWDTFSEKDNIKYYKCILQLPSTENYDLWKVYVRINKKLKLYDVRFGNF